MPSVLAEATDAPVPPAPTKPDMNVSQPTDQDRDDLLAIDSAVDRMRALIPSDPYVLTIPQDVEPRYHHSYQLHAHQWLDRAPFDRREHENSQYQTFHFHEPGKDMFVLHNSWREDPPPSDTRDKPKSSAPGTGSNTPNPVKKMSLNAYKKKQAGATPSQDTKPSTEDSASKQPAVKGPIERVKETEHVLASLAEPELQEALREPKELKRKRPDDTQPNAKDTPAQKKPRQVSPLRRTVKEKAPVAKPVLPPRKRTEPALPPADSIKLPPKLSPLHYPDLELPKRLSPTLPAVYERMLDARDLEAREKQKSTTLATEPAATKEKHSSPKTNGTAQPKSTALRNGYRADSISPGSRKREAARAKSPDADSSQGEEIPVKTRKTGEKKSMIIKLKYKRNNRERVARLLNMRPMPLKPPVDGVDHHNDDGNDEPSQNAIEPKRKDRIRDPGEKGVAQKLGPAKATDAKRAENSRLQNKRPRSIERPSKNPSTPMRPELVSPALLSSAVRGSQQATPAKKDARSVAMRREQSSESNALTPSDPSTSTPSANGTGAAGSHHKAPSSQPIGSSKTPMQEAWEMEQKRLDKLGRELKHEATAHSGKADKLHGRAAEMERLLAAFKSLESFLCYFLSFSCADEAARCAEPRGGPAVKYWVTLPPFHGFVRRHCEVSDESTGIACQLGVVALSRVFELSGSHSSETSSQQKRSDTWAATQRASRDMAAKLNDETIKRTFPETWARRTKTKDSREARDPIFCKMQAPGKYDGEYELPVGSHTPPVMAVRLCFSELLELAKRHPETDYTPKLKLD